MLALLKMIPGVHYVYAALIAGLLVSFGAYTVHQRHLGAAHELAAIKKVTAAAQLRVQTVTDAAQLTEIQNAHAYQTAVAVPVLSTGLSCVHTAVGSGKVPPAGGAGVPGAGKPDANSGVGPPYDPSGAALARARQADAQIVWLQARVHELEQQMENGP